MAQRRVVSDVKRGDQDAKTPASAKAPAGAPTKPQTPSARAHTPSRGRGIGAPSTPANQASIGDILDRSEYGPGRIDKAPVGRKVLDAPVGAAEKAGGVKKPYEGAVKPTLRAQTAQTAGGITTDATQRPASRQVNQPHLVASLAPSLTPAAEASTADVPRAMSRQGPRASVLDQAPAAQRKKLVDPSAPLDKTAAPRAGAPALRRPPTDPGSVRAVRKPVPGAPKPAGASLLAHPAAFDPYTSGAPIYDASAHGARAATPCLQTGVPHFRAMEAPPPITHTTPFVLSIPVARGANWFLAGGGRRMDEEEATAAAAERIAAAAEDGTSLPVRLATDVVRFLYGGTGRREPADGGVVSASLLNAKPAVGGIGVEPRGGGVLRVLFTVASDAVADTVVRWRHELRRCVDSTAVFDVLSAREEAQHQALWPAFLAAKVAGKRAQFHRARLVVDGERTGVHHFRAMEAPPAWESIGTTFAVQRGLTPAIGSRASARASAAASVSLPSIASAGKSTQVFAGLRGLEAVVPTLWRMPLLNARKEPIWRLWLLGVPGGGGGGGGGCCCPPCSYAGHHVLPGGTRADTALSGSKPCGSSTSTMASAGDFTMEQAKARSNNSAVKNLLYGGDAVSSEIGAQKGKKAMGYHASHPAPFATTNEGGCSGEVHKGKKTTGDHASYAAPYSTTEEGAHGGRVAEATKGKKTVGDHSSRTAPFATSEHVAAHPAYGQPSVSKNSKLKEQGAGKSQSPSGKWKHSKLKELGAGKMGKGVGEH
ncbi:hypothetical protein FOA52_011395 [Chlamydomonas sp. UWO 241]|nr:hypothetical protein FOA52_011395 [Chlamydomonas sp. UWO 241]